jgi:hypothetical protein
VAGQRQPEQARPLEAESNDADVGPSVVKVGLGAGRGETLDGLNRNMKIEQQQVAPVGGQQWSFGHAVC